MFIFKGFGIFKLLIMIILLVILALAILKGMAQNFI